MDNSLKEIVFWGIFVSIALLLLYGQMLVSTPAVEVTKPSQISEYLPDISKTEKDAVLFYENNTFEKLKEIPKRKFVYGLGEYSGPAFSENSVKDGAFQTSLQSIIDTLEIKKEDLKKAVVEKGFSELAAYVNDIFQVIYQYLSNDSSLVIIYKIWKKSSGPVLTYYYLTLFDDEYALTIIELYASEQMEKFEEKGLNFKELWKTIFNK
ncbi:MAG: hypothetical protein ACK4R7_00710 [Fervidobacterium sp.]